MAANLGKLVQTQRAIGKHIPDPESYKTPDREQDRNVQLHKEPFIMIGYHYI